MAERTMAESTPAQDVRFCRSRDGVNIAYAVHGSGPPLVIDACWLSHLQFDWQSPVWRHFLLELGQFATVIRFDERGHGLSDREVSDFSLEARIGDLEAVVDDAGLGSFALLAMAQGGPVSIAYAARHPERVARLVFYGSYSAVLRGATPADIERGEAFDQMVKVGWAQPESEFRRVFTSLMIPNATEEQKGWLDELQRVAVSAEVAYVSRRERKLADTTHLLPHLRIPTLVLHSRGDRMNDFEQSRFLASSISGARLVALDSPNHIVLEDEPAWLVFVHEVRSFLTGGAGPSGTAGMARCAFDADGGFAEVTLPSVTLAPVTLTRREREVLDLAARGASNADIARTLFLSVRTVERHLSNVYGKLDCHGSTARTAAVAHYLTTA